MGSYAGAFGPHAPGRTYIDHRFDEHIFDTGEVLLNFAVTGDDSRPPLLLIPGQTESWWGYELVMPLLADRFHVFAVDLRGQGRSTRTPGRYTLDNIANDLVRFIDGAIGRPTIVAGLSSGGVIAAWLAAYAAPNQVVAAYLEDPPLFASETRPAVGPGIDQCVAPLFAHLAKYLGDQWSVGDWEGLVTTVSSELPERLAWVAPLLGLTGDEPPQPLREYDPEWGRAFATGTVSASCDHRRMLSAVKVPVLFTHHFRAVDESNGTLMGAIADVQASQVGELVTAAGNDFRYESFPTIGHFMHVEAPDQYVDTLVDWSSKLAL